MFPFRMLIILENFFFKNGIIFLLKTNFLQKENRGNERQLNYEWWYFPITNNRKQHAQDG